MNEKEILVLLSRISDKLEQGEACIKKNQWDEVGNLFKQVETLQEKIKKNDPPLDAMISKSASFKKEYEFMKSALLAKTNGIISLIESWKVDQAGKISGSKNVLDNLSKYYKPGNTAYYIDTNE